MHDVALVSGTMCAMKMQVWGCAGNGCETWVDCLLDSAVHSMADAFMGSTLQGCTISLRGVSCVGGPAQGRGHCDLMPCSMALGRGPPTGVEWRICHSTPSCRERHAAGCAALQVAVCAAQCLHKGGYLQGGVATGVLARGVLLQGCTVSQVVCCKCCIAARGACQAVVCPGVLVSHTMLSQAEATSARSSVQTSYS